MVTAVMYPSVRIVWLLFSADRCQRSRAGISGSWRWCVSPWPGGCPLVPGCLRGRADTDPPGAAASRRRARVSTSYIGIKELAIFFQKHTPTEARTRPMRWPLGQLGDQPVPFPVAAAAGAGREPRSGAPASGVMDDGLPAGCAAYVGEPGRQYRQRTRATAMRCRHGAEELTAAACFAISLARSAA